jgi:hypothetical protein
MESLSFLELKFMVFFGAFWDLNLREFVQNYRFGFQSDNGHSSGT